MYHPLHPVGTSVISALFEEFYNRGLWGKYFGAYTNDQYI